MFLFQDPSLGLILYLHSHRLSVVNCVFNQCHLVVVELRDEGVVMAEFGIVGMYYGPEVLGDNVLSFL